MAKRQSAFSLGSLLVTRSRSMTSSRSRTSSAVARCGRSHAFFSHCCKLTFVPDQEQLRSAKHVEDKMMSCPPLAFKLAGRVDRRVNLPAKPTLRRHEQACDVCEFH